MRVREGLADSESVDLSPGEQATRRLTANEDGFEDMDGGWISWRWICLIRAANRGDDLADDLGSGRKRTKFRTAIHVQRLLEA
jgi:hypothetical protein